MILCDIGNTRMHFYDGKRVAHLSHEEGLRRYKNAPVRFICVNEAVRRRIEREAPAWRDLSSCRLLETAYRGLGIDREAACLGVEDGIVVDAGSAITVDIVEEGVHRGGWIWPGLAAMRRAYAAISPVLERPLEVSVPLDRVPMETGKAVSFGILSPIATVIARFRRGRRIVVTGGDAETVAAILPGAVVDETVVFKGMKKMIETKEKPC